MTKEAKKILECIHPIALIILESGGETYRVEETIEYLILSYGFKDPNVFVTATGIFFSFSDDKNTYSDVIRVKKRGINLDNIDKVNQILSDTINKKISIETSILKSNEILHGKRKKKILFTTLAAGISGALFTLLYGGNYFDFCVAIVCGIIIQWVTMLFKRIDIFHFANSFIGGTITAIIALIATSTFHFGNFDKIVIGSIMPILPGLALTNSIKDTLTGNLVSGMSRLGEVILIGLAIASGVGIVLSTYIYFGGVLIW